MYFNQIKLPFDMSAKFPGRSRLITLAACALLWGGCSHSVSTTNPPAHTLSLPDSVKLWLNDQSSIIGFYAAVAQDSNYLDTAILPAWAAARVYQALGTLWQTTGMPERDTVFDVYALREGGDNDFHSVIVCGNPQSPYQPVLDRYHFTRDTALSIIVFRSPLLLNTIAVAWEINDSLGIHDRSIFLCAEPDWLIGGGDHVQAYFEQGAVKLTFTVGWGDCPSGCMHRRYWNFRVYDSGDVRFLGASGDPPPTQAQRRG